MSKMYIIVIVLITIASSSCKKYLDVKSDLSKSVITDLSGLQLLLDAEISMNSKCTPCLKEASSDDYFITDAYYNGGSILLRKFYIWEAEPYTYSNDWTNAYRAVYNTNYTLETLQKIDPSSNQVQWNSIKGSALFFKSFFNNELIGQFAKAYNESTASNDLGIVLRMGSDFNVASKRSTVKESYNLILSDAKEAAGLLLNYSTTPTRPSKTAAYGLLARIYLSMRAYDSAGKYANLCLGLNSDLINYNGHSDLLGLDLEQPFKRFGAETIFYSTLATTNPLSTHGNTTGLIDTVLFNSYAPNDLRKRAFFMANGNYRKFKGFYSDLPEFFSGIATDELYLIRAECFARDGKKTEALSDLNKLLSNRIETASFSPVIAQTSQEALEIILRERRKELLMRGIRWTDIKRLNMEGAGITPKRFINGVTYTLPPNDKRYARPLPQDIINLTGMPQNDY